MNSPYGPPPGGYGYAPPPTGGFGGGNPYAPPAYGGYTGFGGGYGAPMGPQAPAAGGALKLRFYMLACFIAAMAFPMIGMIFSAISSETEEPAFAAVGAIVMMFAIPAIIAYFVMIFVWVFKSWEMLPQAYRVTSAGKTISPGEAVGFMFIPFFNQFYWNFVMPQGLCDGLNHALAAYGSPRRAPKGFAIACAIMQLIPYINFSLAPFFWLAFVFMVDGAKAEYLRLAQQQGATQQQPVAAY